MITDFSFYQCVPDEHASITARHPNHTAAYTGIGIEISVKQYSTATAARIMIPAIAAIPLKTDFLIYIKTHLSLVKYTSCFLLTNISYQIRCVIKRTLLPVFVLF